MKVLVISSADVRRCPKQSLAAEHYVRLADGTVACQCSPSAGHRPVDR